MSALYSASEAKKICIRYDYLCNATGFEGAGASVLELWKGGGFFALILKVIRRRGEFQDFDSRARLQVMCARLEGPGARKFSQPQPEA